MKEEYKEDKKMKKQNKKQAKKNAMFRKLRKYVKDKYDKEIAKKEKKLGRELDRKEKKKIIDHIINSVGIQAMASRTAVSVAFTGPKISTLALPEGKIPVKEEDKEIEEIPEVKEEVVAEEVIKVENKKEINQEEKDKIEAVETEIDNIENSEEAKIWLKNLYLEKYYETSEKDGEMQPLNINILNKNVENMYKTINGEYVTSVDKKEAAESILEKKGIKYEPVLSGKVYMTINTEDGKIIDCANKINDEYHKVIVAEDYKGKKNTKKSTLVELGGITPTAFYLMDLYNQQDQYQEKYNKTNPILEIKINDAKRILKGRYSNTF